MKNNLLRILKVPWVGVHPMQTYILPILPDLAI